jgi:hypothetical protein
MDAKMTEYDPVTRPRHYVLRAVRCEPIDILRWAPFDLGNALKYMIRAGQKNDALEDLRKAEWYLKCARESARISNYPYSCFMKQYKLILAKFDGIPEGLADAEDWAECLQKSVTIRIELFESEQPSK